MDEPTNHNSATVLKELSDIKASLATNTEKTSNMDKNIGEIKIDIRKIQEDNISRREFTDALTALNVPSIRKDVEDLKEFRWKLAGVTSLAAAAMTFIGQLILKYLSK